MSTLETIGWLGLALLGTAAAAIWSGAETGCYTLNRVRLSVRASGGDRRAKRLSRLLDRQESLLATLLVNNNISNYFGAMGLTAFFMGLGLSETKVVLINTAVLTPFTLIFCESLPKEVFRRASDTLTLRVSGMLWWTRAFFMATGVIPLVVWVGRVAGRLAGLGEVQAFTDSRARVAMLLKEGSASGAITEAQSTLIDRATVFTRTRVSEEMVPWAQVRAVLADMEPSRAARIVHASGHAALPVIDRRGAVVGVVRALDILLQPNAPLRTHLAEAVRVSERTRVVDALRQLQVAGQSLAIVERAGRPVGIVTTKDLVEPLVGGGDAVPPAGV